MLSFNDIMPTKSIGGYKQNKFKNKQHNIFNKHNNINKNPYNIDVNNKFVDSNNYKKPLSIDVSLMSPVEKVDNVNTPILKVNAPIMIHQI